MKIDKWKKFEKVVSAIHNVEQEGTLVKWNSRLEGHRFDAVLRSEYEQREYLIVVDFVEYGTPVNALATNRFVKKIEAVSADMGIMVSASEFLPDSFELSGKHSIAFLDWKTIEKTSEEKMGDNFKLARLTYDFRFKVDRSSNELKLPEEPPVLKFLMREIQVKGKGIDTNPEKLVYEVHEEIKRTAICKPQRKEISFPSGTVIIHPNTRTEIPVKAFAFTYRLIPRAELINPQSVLEDAYGVESTLKDELAKRNLTADASKIESGFDTVLRPGRFYYNPKLQFSYYCEEVKKGKAKIVLVESYQNDRLLQDRRIISRRFHTQFVEVTEQSEVERLTKLYDTFSVSDKNLEGRFKVFLRDYEGAESIDNLELTHQQEKANKADYFFQNRTIIGELKSLYEDMSSKVETVLAPYRNTPEFPHFYGAQELSTIIKHLPDRDKINAQIIKSVTKSVESRVEKANRQIRATKETFDLPESGGLLIILNDTIDILTPDLMSYIIRRSLNKRKTPGGELRFPNVSAVLVIDGAHYIQLNPELKGIPILTIANNVPEAGFVLEFISELEKKWTDFGGMPFIEGDATELQKLKFTSFKRDEKQFSNPMTRSNYWRLMYRANPYLRQMSEEQLLDFGANAFEDVSLLLVKGAPKLSMEETEPKWIRWTHFLEESGLRALDLRKLGEKIQDIGEKIEEQYQKYLEQSDSNNHN